VVSGNAEARSAEGACGGEVKVVVPCGWAFEEEEARGAAGAGGDERVVGMEETVSGEAG